MTADDAPRPIVVRGTALLPTDTHEQYAQKIARIVLDEMYQFVGVLDTEGTVLECNRPALDGGGLMPADVIGKPFWECFWWTVSRKAQEDVRDAVARAARGETIRYDVEIYGKKSGTETIIIDFTLRPVRDQDGRVVLLLPEGRDITEKKAREREIAQKNIELQGLLERIRELDAIKTQLFANVSHELRTPLTLILGPAQRLLDEEREPGRAQIRDAAQVIARNSRILLKHVNDLLELSKLDAGKLKIELVETDVAALVRLLGAHFQLLAADRKIDFAITAHEPCVSGVDPEKLERVVMNLLANAFKFVPTGGRIQCALRQSSDELILSVDDSGPGVEPELRQAIFERFRQGDGGKTRKVGGTGLGLAIAKELVEIHKGRIDVLDSALGGARFEVTIPLHRAASRAVRPKEHSNLDHTMLAGFLEELRPSVPPQVSVRAEADGTASAKERVLVVEDNADMNRFITECLSKDYQVFSAFDGRDGLEKAVAFGPALVVTDLMMPNLSGDEMIAEMRRIPELERTPVLLLSAKADEDLMVRLLDNGAQDFVVKPFSERELAVRVRNLILTQRAREEATQALMREHEAREQVERLRDAAEAANRTKDEFLAMLGHELRNPLSPILTAVQLMKLKGSAASDRERTIIERQVSHLTRLVDDLLDVSRIARGKVELKAELVEMADLVARAIEVASPLLEQRHQNLTVNVPRRGLVVHGDPIRLSQVISNLLTNASKYTPAGGDVTVAAELEGRHVAVCVRDSGVGIAPEVLPTIFDLFVQGRQSLDRSQGGLGLGLAIVRNLVERHGGSVSARSDGRGHGSEFVVRLPKAERSEEIAELDTVPTSVGVPIPRPGVARILVVDDNEDAADLLAASLARKGYDTRVAHDGPSALRVAAEFLPDIGILDIGLPVMDGYELAAHIPAIPGLASIRLIAVTGYGQEADRRKARDAGFEHHFVKPVGLEEISAVVSGRGLPDRPRESAA